jgi:hypothetical protein
MASLGLSDDWSVGWTLLVAWPGAAAFAASFGTALRKPGVALVGLLLLAPYAMLASLVTLVAGLSVLGSLPQVLADNSTALSELLWVSIVIAIAIATPGIPWFLAPLFYSGYRQLFGFTCRRCRARNPSQAAFCGNCGFPSDWRRSAPAAPSGWGLSS